MNITCGSNSANVTLLDSLLELSVTLVIPNWCESSFSKPQIYICGAEQPDFNCLDFKSESQKVFYDLCDGEKQR